jgi:hypothetical protein
MSEKKYIYQVWCTRTSNENQFIYSDTKLEDKEIIKKARDNCGNWEVSDSEEKEISVVEMFKRKDGGLSEKVMEK